MKYRILLWLSLLVPGVASAQQNADVDDTLPAGVLNAYFEQVGEQAVIYSGKVQQMYPNSIRNHPYFKNEKPGVGEMCYDGIVYQNITLRYDLYRSAMLLMLPNKLYSVELQNDMVDYVNLFGYHIINFKPDGLPGCPAAGYYVLLHDGDFKILEKQLCIQESSQEDRVLDLFFTQMVRYYICKDNVYYPVKSKGALLKVFKEHKRELNQLIREQGLHFKRNPEEMVLAVAREYERLNKFP